MSIWDGIALFGVLAVIAGIALVCVPLAVIAGGVACVAVGILGERNDGPTQPPVRPSDPGSHS